MNWKRIVLFAGIMLFGTGVMTIVYSDFVVTGWDPIYVKHMIYLEAWRSIGIVLLSLGIVVLIGMGFLCLKGKR